MKKEMKRNDTKNIVAFLRADLELCLSIGYFVNIYYIK